MMQTEVRSPFTLPNFLPTAWTEALTVWIAVLLEIPGQEEAGLLKSDSKEMKA